MVGGGDPFYLEFWVNWPSSASAVTPSEKVFGHWKVSTSYLY